MTANKDVDKYLYKYRVLAVRADGTHQIRDEYSLEDARYALSMVSHSTEFKFALLLKLSWSVVDVVSPP